MATDNYTKIKFFDSEDKKIHLDIDDQGDHYLTIFGNPVISSLRFCSAQGGGAKWHHTKLALKHLCLAMKKDGATEEGVPIETRIKDSEESRKLIDDFEKDRNQETTYTREELAPVAEIFAVAALCLFGDDIPSDPLEELSEWGVNRCYSNAEAAVRAWDKSQEDLRAEVKV